MQLHWLIEIIFKRYVTHGTNSCNAHFLNMRIFFNFFQLNNQSRLTKTFSKQFLLGLFLIQF